MPSAEHRLGLRTLFIVPSRFGILWLGAALLLLLVGIQTSSNSSLLLGFLLLGLFSTLTTIIDPFFQNLSHKLGHCFKKKLPKVGFLFEASSLMSDWLPDGHRL